MDAPRRAAGEHGWAEIVVLTIFAAVIGFAFLWALVLHEKPLDEEPAAVGVSGTTTVTLTPPTLPAPRKYEVDGGVNLREGPATNTTILAKLKDRAKVKVICRIEGQDVTGNGGSTNLWLRIDIGQFGVGYASALYIDVGDDIEDTAKIGDCALAPVG
jgi:hypothetical protein